MCDASVATSTCRSHRRAACIKVGGIDRQLRLWRCSCRRHGNFRAYGCSRTVETQRCGRLPGCRAVEPHEKAAGLTRPQRQRERNAGNRKLIAGGYNLRNRDRASASISDACRLRRLQG